jgi:hypothetical protein
VAISPAIAKRRARVARKSQDHAPDDPELLDAKRDLKTELVAEYIEKILASAPPLSDEQRNALAELLRPARRNGGA